MKKTVKMMILNSCPHCRNAFKMMETLKEQHPEYRDVEIDVIEEQLEEERTKGYDYWYVPTFFVDDVKIHEGVPTLEKIDAVFQTAIK